MDYPSDFRHVPDEAYVTPRRQFLKRLLAGSASATVLPSLGLTGELSLKTSRTEHLAQSSLSNRADEAYWALVKDQFPLRPGFILMNAANLCPSPYPVIEAVIGLTRDVDEDASFQNRSKFGTLLEEALNALATFLGADANEMVITRNTSEGNNIVINGLRLNPGDEVLLWDENHPSNNLAWDARAGHVGFTVKKVSLPKGSYDEDALIEPFRRVLSPKTKVFAFSHVSNVSGIALPAHSLCTLARDHGVLTLIDGAQTFGAQQVHLHDIGCDFYTGSSHKWFMGPKETGVLFVRRDKLHALQPSIVSVGWEDDIDNAHRYLGTLGQRDDARVSAVKTAVVFHNTIGKERIENRIRFLAAELKERLRERLPDTQFLTPLVLDRSGGVVVFISPRITNTSDVFATLYRDYQIGCAAMSGGFRLCPHVYNTLDEVDRVVDAFADLVQA